MSKKNYFRYDIHMNIIYDNATCYVKAAEACNLMAAKMKHRG